MTQEITYHVNPDDQYQVWEGWGTTLAWWAHVIGGAAAETRQIYTELLFDREQGLGFNIVRYNIGGGENPAYPEHMDYRARIPGYRAAAEQDYDWKQDEHQRSILLAAKSLIDPREFIAEAFANSPPWWMTESGSVTGNHAADENLSMSRAEEFADYLVTVLERFESEWGVAFRTLSPVNEPSSTYWTFGNRQEGNVMYAANQTILIDALYDRLLASSLQTGISAPEETDIDLCMRTIMSYPAHTRHKLAQFNTHSYSGSNRAGLRLAAEGKRIWNSEHGDGDRSGLTMSFNILKDIKEIGISAWVYWQAVEPPGGWGMLETELSDPYGDRALFVKTPKCDMMSQWSKAIRPGYQFIGLSDEWAVAAYDRVNHRLVIVAVNVDPFERSVRYDLSRFVHVSSVVTASHSGNQARWGRSRYSAQVIEPHVMVTLPPESTSTFVLEATVRKEYLS